MNLKIQTKLDDNIYEDIKKYKIEKDDKFGVVCFKIESSIQKTNSTCCLILGLNYIKTFKSQLDFGTYMIDMTDLDRNNAIYLILKDGKIIDQIK